MKTAIELILQNTPDIISNEFIPLQVKINIDGLLFLKSSVVSAWPILAIISIYKEPLPIAVFCGAQKPNLNDFLTDLIKELHDLKLHGMYFNETHLRITVCM